METKENAYFQVTSANASALTVNPAEVVASGNGIRGRRVSEVGRIPEVGRVTRVPDGGLRIPHDAVDGIPPA
jgi:hypothetical protein